MLRVIWLGSQFLRKKFGSNEASKWQEMRLAELEYAALGNAGKLWRLQARRLGSRQVRGRLSRRHALYPLDDQRRYPSVLGGVGSCATPAIIIRFLLGRPLASIPIVAAMMVFPIAGSPYFAVSEPTHRAKLRRGKWRNVGALS